MNYEPKLNNGTRVHRVVNDTVPRWVQCVFCRGSKTITCNDITRTCPECSGRGGAHEWIDTGWHVFDRVLTIGQIVMRHTDRQEPEWEVMCKETGVGSGTVYRMDDVFTSTEEAQAECDRRNKVGGSK